MIKKLIQQKSTELRDELIAIRRHLHANPELSFEEYETSKFVQSKLDEYGVSYSSGIVGTGIVALIKADATTDKCIALRADLDALPITETTEANYASTKEGVMHACGHDVHTTILLGVAKVLQANREHLKANVKLIFQPGEEKLPGGASLMIKEGVLENPKVNEMYALHVFPEMEAGKVGVKSGMYMASCDEVYMTIKGKGGHGAMPQQNIDPILISAHLITSLQQIVSRNCPPQIPCVLSFGRIEGLGATNVIPSEVKLEGTFRTMNEEWRADAHEKIKFHAETLAQSMGGTVEVEIRKGYPFLENDPRLTDNLNSLFQEHFGEENVEELPLRLTAEDFSYYSQVIPCSFFRLGVRNESKGITAPVHNSKFDIDESALTIGVAAFLNIVFKK